ncbi:hypothetical protein Sjap_007689 [Stephania japonica]|uniref:Uncharacterized protein n=1 Tax=Stephania japonica TaxID=461633 RepID=A0AAP0PDX9_9MAGN
MSSETGGSLLAAAKLGLAETTEDSTTFGGLRWESVDNKMRAPPLGSTAARWRWRWPWEEEEEEEEERYA